MLNPESGYSADRYTSLLGDSMARVTSLKKSEDMGGDFLRNGLHDGGGKRTGVVWRLDKGRKGRFVGDSFTSPTGKTSARSSCGRLN